MNIFPMPGEILSIPYAMIGKPALPNFLSSELQAECVRVSALNELDGAFQSDIARRRQQ